VAVSIVVDRRILMSNAQRTNPIHRSLSKPLAILGVERKLFFLAMLIGAATFNLFGSLLGGLLMFVVLFLALRLATAKDPQMLRILLNASKFRSRYDSAKHELLVDKGIDQHD
jgi:type IV secretory pathway TrbD component